MQSKTQHKALNFRQLFFESKNVFTKVTIQIETVSAIDDFAVLNNKPSVITSNLAKVSTAKMFKSNQKQFYKHRRRAF